MNLYNLSILCFGFCSFLLGLFVWLKREDKIGKRYFVMASFYSGWAIFIAINLNNDISHNLGLFMGRLGNAFAVFIPVTWYHFVTTYAGSSKTKRNFLKILYTISVLFTCFSFSSWFIPEVKPMVGFKYYSQAGPLYWFFAMMFFTIVPLSFVELYKKIKVSSGYERQQLKGLFITSLVGYVGGSPTFLPIFGIPFPQYTLILLPFYPFMLAYFMIKQKLFDINSLVDFVQEAKLNTLGVIASSINHEVRNPLYVIKGLAETLLEKVEGYDQEKIKEIAEKTIAQSDRALGIIRNFSTYAKRETGKVYEAQPVRAKELIERILPFVESELKLKGITVTQEIPEDVTVLADRQSLEEIFLNLLINACQAIKETGKAGEIVIRAYAPSPSSSPSLAKGDEGGFSKSPQAPLYQRVEMSGSARSNSVILEIADNGPGIPAANLNRIFEPFFTTKPGGTGLGLYIVKQLIDKNKGRISVESELDKGTTFTVALPTS